MACHTMLCYDMLRSVMIRRKLQYDTSCYVMVWCGMVCCMVGYGMVWYVNVMPCYVMVWVCNDMDVSIFC